MPSMDPYVYPGTNVLKNLRDIRDGKRLAEFEAEATARRLRQLEQKPITGSFDAQHLRRVHHHMFQDVYPWAGEFRTVDLAKSGDLFALKQHVVPSLNKTCEELRKERQLKGSDPQRFSGRAAYYLGEINAVHPFREGNGRTQREFMRELALQNGYRLNWSRVTQDQMIEASRQSFRVDNVGLEKLIRQSLDVEQDRRRFERGGEHKR